MSRKIRENFLVTKGNLGFFGPGGGVAVYNTANTTGKGPTVNVPPGQLVIYDPVTLLTVNVATWNKTDNGRFVLGVGYDGEGKGYSTDIRKSFGDIFHGCHIRTAIASNAACGLTAIKDAVLTKCLPSNEPVAINITVTDHSTMNEFPYQTNPVWTFTGYVPSDLCTACDDPMDCSKLVKSLNDQINNPVRLDRRKNLRTGAFPRQDFPFAFAPLYSTSYQFCISPVNSACETCAYVAGITGLEIDGDVVDFDFTTIAGNANYTSFGQLQYVADQITAAVGGKGTATIFKSVCQCCPYQIEINTCLEIGDLQTLSNVGATVTVAPCSTSNPFEAIEIAADSLLCDAEGSTITPTCGFRVMARPIEFDHSCYIDLMPPRYLTRDVNIYGGKNTPFPFTVKDIQVATQPTGLGITWALREYNSSNGGSGRGQNGDNRHYGPLGTPGRKDRVNAVEVNPRIDYASLVIEHMGPSAPMEFISHTNVLNGTTIILTPNGDTTTKTAITNAFNQYFNDNYCNPIPDLNYAHTHF